MSAIREDLQIQLQDRDLILLRGLFESRVATLSHLAALYFDGKAEAAKKRIQKLKAAGLLRERKRRVNEPSVLFLSRIAFTLLQDSGELAKFPRISHARMEKRAAVSDLTLRHELEVMDVKAALVSAVNRLPQFSIAEFSTWPLLFQFRATADNVKMLVKPDGFIRIEEEDAEGLAEHNFFLEVDRSTEPQETLVRKAACYLDYYQRGGFAVRNGQSRDEYKDFPFRVLMVLKSAERRDNTVKTLLARNPPILTQTWLSTFSEATSDPLGRIWVRPLDYRNAPNGANVTKHPLLDEAN